MSNTKKVRIQKPVLNPDDKVIIGYLHPGTVQAEFMRSIINLWAYDLQNNARLFHGGGLIEWKAGSNVAGPRNGLVKQFMGVKSANWLLMVDSDMTFEPNALDKLLSVADPATKPIVGGLCFGFDGPDGFHSPTIYYLFEKGEDGNPFFGRARFWKSDLEKVAGTGAAFLLIHRSVFEKFDAFNNDAANENVSGFSRAYPYFQETEYFGNPIGEDITFCMRANLLGIPVYVDTTCHIGHVKDRVLNVDSYLAQFAGVKDDNTESDAA